MSVQSQVAVLGAEGMLGSAVVHRLGLAGLRVVPLSRADYDILRDPIDMIVDKLGPQENIIVNCIAALDMTLPPETVLAVNSIFPKKLAHMCETMKDYRVIHISTDGVFSGSRGGYSERDIPDPNDLYGVSKFLGEDSRNMVLRTSLVGHDLRKKRHFLEWVLTQKGKVTKGFTNHFWNGVSVQTLAGAIESIVRRDMFRPGIFHVTSPAVVSKYELIQMISRVYDLDLDIVPTLAPKSCDRSLTTQHGLSREVIKEDLIEQLVNQRKESSSR